MKQLSALVVVLCAAASLEAQAPSSAFLWKLADQTLATPAALVDGPTGMFWNPAALAGGDRTAAGIQLFRAPAVVGIDGLVLGVSTRLTPQISAGVTVGRLDMRDIVRTTSSPISQLGTITIYDQMAAVALAATVGPASLGATVRAHDSRFDVESEGGVTSDVGVILRPTRKLTVAASTHLQPTDFERGDATEYLVGAEYDVGRLPVGADSLTLALRYGFVSASRGRTDHTLGANISVRGVMHVAAVITREDGFEGAEYRPTVEVSLALGRYLIGVARSEGLNGLGASYRINFDLMLLQ